jgi:hypothetical protein
MPRGTHTSIRVALAVPPRIHEQLKAWADYEGRPIASLCLYLIEHALRQAQRDGIAPSYGNESVDNIEKIEEPKPRFLGHRYETTTPVVKEPPKLTKKEALMAALSELLDE